MVFVPGAKNGCTFLNGQGEKIIRIKFCDKCQSCKIQISVSRICTADRHAHPVMCPQWLLSRGNSRAGGLPQRGCRLQSQRNLLSVRVVYRKSGVEGRRGRQPRGTGYDRSRCVLEGRWALVQDQEEAPGGPAKACPLPQAWSTAKPICWSAGLKEPRVGQGDGRGGLGERKPEPASPPSHPGHDEDSSNRVTSSEKQKKTSGCGEIGTWWDERMGQPLCKTAWQFLKKLYAVIK